MHVLSSGRGTPGYPTSARAPRQLRLRVAAWVRLAPLRDAYFVSHGLRKVLNYIAAYGLLDTWHRVRSRLGELSSRLGDADWLDGAFSAGDLLMVTVLRRWSSSVLLDPYPKLCGYVARGEAGPAYQRAFADQLAVFTGPARTP